MLLNVFNVDHGACALVTTSNGRRMMIDCGHHDREGWFPGAALNAMGIYTLDRLVITNFDEDHCSGLADLSDRTAVGALMTNGTISSQTVRHMKAENGMGHGIRRLVESMENDFTGGPVPVADQADFGDTSFSFYRNPYSPAFGFKDANNLSLVTFVRCGPHKIIFPGDLERLGWMALLRDPAFVRELQGVTLFVASHHGRLSGYCPEAISLCPRIQAVIFSDGGIVYETQETAGLYRKHATGILFDGQLRRVLTTRTDRSMRFQLDQMGGGNAFLNVAA